MGLPVGAPQGTLGSLDSSRTWLKPSTLYSGPQSGLVNNLMALFGYVELARKKNMALLLPNFTTHVAGGATMRFTDLFQPEPFQRALAQINITVGEYNYHQIVASNGTIRVWPVNRATGGRLTGWFVYKYGRTCSRAEICKKALGEIHTLERSQIEAAVLRGLVANDNIRRRVHFVKDGFQGKNMSYGCLHARIEDDMAKAWGFNRAGPPPRLQRYITGIERNAKLRAIQSIFVAVGVAIREEDKIQLSRKTTWGARFYLSRGKTHHVGAKNATLVDVERKKSQEASYTAAALVDLLVCREADWFVGWPGSTFSRLLGVFAWVDRGSAWHYACPSSVDLFHTTSPSMDWKDHNACRDVENVTKIDRKTLTEATQKSSKHE